MDPLVTDLVRVVGGYEALSDVIASEFPDLEVPTCDLSTSAGRRRYGSFLCTRDRVKAFMRRRLRAEEAPASALSDLPAPESPVSETSIDGVRVTSGHTDTTDPVRPERAEAVPVRSHGVASVPCIGTGVERREREMISSRDRAYIRAVQNLQVVLDGRSDPSLEFNPARPLHEALGFAKVSAVLRPKQPPSARRTIVSALPEVAGLAPALDLHPVLASHATTEAEKLLKGKVKMLGELRSDVVRCLNQALSLMADNGIENEMLLFSILSAAGVVEHYVSQELRSVRGHFYQKARTAKPMLVKQYFTSVVPSDSEVSVYVGSELPALASFESLMASGLLSDTVPKQQNQNKKGKQQQKQKQNVSEDASASAPKAASQARGRSSERKNGQGGKSF